ncbi:MAG: aminotransferase class V-fold PLP-dependent enzyme, partial [Acidimicrobiia bacterium]|nr:aminotransferase class V-fold PLP-dependent enzyme [Acidimicrobiia bacterium]
NACRNALEFVASRAGARIVVVPIPFPIDSSDTVTDLVLGAITERTRVVLVDHVTSATALILPIDRIIAGAESRGVPVLVDGAHGPGMLPLDLESLGASYYTGNCHKWICSPKGAALLYARPDRQADLTPVSISHGWNDPRLGRPRFHKLFDWTGTEDPSAVLSVPEAIRFMGSLLPGGWPALMDHNHRLVLEARDLICEALGIDAPAPDDMIGSMAALPLPDGEGLAPQSVIDAMSERLRLAGFEVPAFIWPGWPKRILRISAQAYNTIAQFERLAAALKKELS